MRLDGAFFDLTDRFTPATPRADRRIVISVPKRLLRSAVRRNTVKRLVREAWRQTMPSIGEPVSLEAVFLVRLRSVPLPVGEQPARVKVARPIPAVIRLSAGACAGGREWRRLLRSDIDALLRKVVRRTAATGVGAK